MKLLILKEKIVDMINLVANNSDKRGNNIYLANLYIDVKFNSLTILTSDLQVEMVARCELQDNECINEGKFTVNTRKFYEICKSVQPESILEITYDEDHNTLVVICHKTRFKLSTLPHHGFPLMSESSLSSFDTDHPCEKVKATLMSTDLKKILNKTLAFSAISDVRYYLTGILLEFSKSNLRAVATDGHRLGLCETDIFSSVDNNDIHKCILHKKTISELLRLINNNQDDISLVITNDLLHTVLEIPRKNNIIQVKVTAKHIEGNFPDYNRVIPKLNKNKAIMNLNTFKSACQRVGLMSEDMMKSINLDFGQNLVTITSNTKENEGSESFTIDYNGNDLLISFNSAYILDVLNVIDDQLIQIDFNENTQACLFLNPDDHSQKYIIMPMKNQR